jgi:hypothetical protein
MDFDFDEHIRLQQQVTRETLATKPDGLTQYEIVAREQGRNMQLQLTPPFELSDKAVEAVREMFLFNKKSGQSITVMRLTFTQTEGKAWRMASDYEHA